MEKLISKVVGWIVFIPAVMVANFFTQKLFVKCVEQAFLYSTNIGMFLLLLIPGLFVWMVIGFFVFSIFKTLAGICPSAKGAKITLIIVSLIALSNSYFRIIEANQYSFFQELGIFIWVYSLHGFTIRGAVDRHEQEMKKIEIKDSEKSINLFDDVTEKAA